MNHAIRTAVAALALSCGMGGAALGGGAMLDEAEDHAYYFGYVKDANGTAVENAKIKMQTKAITLMTQSNVMGAYKLPVIGAQVNPGDVTLSCSKEGYRQTDVIRRTGSGGDGKDPVEIDCTLERQ